MQIARDQKIHNKVHITYLQGENLKYNFDK